MTMLQGGSGVKRAFAVPDPPANWLAATKTAWRRFWAGPLAPYVIESDLDTLSRLFRMVDMQARFWREGSRQPLVEGSQGQPVTNPLLDEADRLETLIQRLEDKFGKGPLARLKLGVALGDAARSLDELNDALSADEGDVDAPDEPDPRLEVG